MEAMRDSRGFEIREGLYEDQQEFHYYYIKETPDGLMKKEASDKGYSHLDVFTASNIKRISRQKDLINLIVPLLPLEEHPFKKDGDPSHPSKRY